MRMLDFSISKTSGKVLRLSSLSSFNLACELNLWWCCTKLEGSLSALIRASWWFWDLLSPSNTWSTGSQKRSSGCSDHPNVTKVGWNEPLVAPFQWMKPGKFAHAGIKSLNRYNPESLENNPECPGGVLAVLWNDVRRTEFIRDFSEWKILGFILIHVKNAKWASAALYLRLAGISPWCCGRENFLNQSLRLCISFCPSPQLSLCCQAVNILVMCPHFSEWQILPLSIISH